MIRYADPLVLRGGSWDEMRNHFQWPELPAFNMASACVERWARQTPDRTALICPKSTGTDHITFKSLNALSNKFANVLAANGITRTDRCAILLPQSLETAICHFAAYKNAAVALPLFTLFGTDGLLYRLQNAGARTVITDAANLPKIIEIRSQLPELQTIFCTDPITPDPTIGLLEFHAEIARAKDTFQTKSTRPSDPALLVYTSGTTGPPKGALHGHRVLLGHLPCTETSHNFLPQPHDLGWTPADWAWMGGLMNIMMPCLYYGITVVAHRMGKFDPDAAYALMQTHNVRNAFLPPTALKLMRQVPAPKSTTLRSIASGGEALGADTFLWARDALNIDVNEIYGQTECNLVLSGSAAVYSAKPGAIGKQTPGSRVTILTEDGDEAPPNTAGEIAIHRDHAGMFLEYWKNPDKTASKFVGDWLLTGDIGEQDEDGYFRFSSRDDDVISSGGYRIGPTEIETCLTSHDAVIMAAVIGVPDDVRGQAIKAFVVLAKGQGGEPLLEALRSHVKTRLSPHLAPKTIVAVDALPMGATGKILRRDLRLLTE